MRGDKAERHQTDKIMPVMIHCRSLAADNSTTVSAPPTKVASSPSEVDMDYRWPFTDNNKCEDMEEERCTIRSVRQPTYRTTGPGTTFRK